MLSATLLFVLFLELVRHNLASGLWKCLFPLLRNSPQKSLSGSLPHFQILLRCNLLKEPFFCEYFIQNIYFLLILCSSFCLIFC